MKLNQSKVVFDEANHTYFLGAKRLLGITGLIHSVLDLGIYPDATEKVKNFFIPRAAEYGHAVHKTIETWDSIGIADTLHPKSPQYQTAENDFHWNTTKELGNYIAHKSGYEAVANEYIVSDGIFYASAIDNVWREAAGNEDEIVLADTKTNNVMYYPGGVHALQQYLSWQLSVYAYLFEQQNPGLKVKMLCCNWLRDTEHAFWIIERQPDEDVALLLSTPWRIDETGSIVYDRDHAASLRAKIHRDHLQGDSALEGAEKTIKDIAKWTQQRDLLDAKLTAAKEDLRARMIKAGATKLENSYFKATLSADTTVTTYDSKAWAKAYPDLAEQFKKTSVKKGALTIKLL